MSEQISSSGNDHLANISRQTPKDAITVEKLPKNQVLLPQAVFAKLRGKTRFRVSVEGSTVILNAFGGKYDVLDSLVDSFAESCDRAWGAPDFEPLERVVKLTAKKRVNLPQAFKAHYESVERFELTMKGTAILLRPLRDQ